MPGERDAAIVNQIGSIMLGLLPDDADTIIADSEADTGYASTTLLLVKPALGTIPYPATAEHDEPVDDINGLILQLRDAMTADGEEPWYGARITIHRDGTFDVQLSYDPLED